eukprot:gene3516-4420_t
MGQIQRPTTDDAALQHARYMAGISPPVRVDPLEDQARQNVLHLQDKDMDAVVKKSRGEKRGFDEVTTRVEALPALQEDPTALKDKLMKMRSEHRVKRTAVIEPQDKEKGQGDWQNYASPAQVLAAVAAKREEERKAALPAPRKEEPEEEPEEEPAAAPGMEEDLQGPAVAPAGEAPPVTATDAEPSVQAPQETAKPAASESKKILPAFLLKRLQARGIVTEEAAQSVTVAAEPSLPPGWAEGFDETYKTKYYFNQSTGVTQWEPPAPTSTEPEKSAAPAKPKGPALPPGWEELVEEESGDTYYFHEASNVTTWDRPEDAAQKAKHGGLHLRGSRLGLSTAWAFARPCLEASDAQSSIWYVKDEAVQRLWRVWPRGGQVAWPVLPLQQIDPMDPSSYSDAPQGGW